MNEQDAMTLLNYEIAINEYIALKGFKPLTAKDASDLNQAYIMYRNQDLFDELIIRLQPIVIQLLKGLPLVFEHQSVNDISDCINFLNEYLIFCIEEGRFMYIKNISDILDKDILDELKCLTFDEEMDTINDHRYDAMYDPYIAVEEELDEELELVRSF